MYKPGVHLSTYSMILMVSCVRSIEAATRCINVCGERISSNLQSFFSTFSSPVATTTCQCARQIDIFATIGDSNYSSTSWTCIYPIRDHWQSFEASLPSRMSLPTGDYHHTGQYMMRSISGQFTTWDQGSGCVVRESLKTNNSTCLAVNPDSVGCPSSTAYLYYTAYRLVKLEDFYESLAILDLDIATDSMSKKQHGTGF
ncbi:hypothetical protein F5880DRAFT_735817 [Lentinula raphanica]|nr:hypothetical protein F5880DRAFT_735817 [Lentinula raphanica]